MTSAVLDGAFSVAALNGVAALLGAWHWYREQASSAFWVCLRLGQGAALVFALGVGALALAGEHPRENLFYLYALLPLAIGFVAEQLRVTSAQTILDQHDLPSSQAVGDLPQSEQMQLVSAIVRREMGVMVLSAVVVVFLALRAAGTAHGF